MTYAYDPFGNPVKTTDAVGNVVTATYDLRGRKIASGDPDLGSWTYAYDALGEIISQTDAKGQNTTASYDLLGRMTLRTEPDMTCTGTSATATMGIGKPASTAITAGPSAGYKRAYTYDSLGRGSSVATTVGSGIFTFTAGYDANSRLTSVAYPSGFTAKYTYN